MHMFSIDKKHYIDVAWRHISIISNRARLITSRCSCSWNLGSAKLPKLETVVDTDGGQSGLGEHHSVYALVVGESAHFERRLLWHPAKHACG